MKKQPKQYIHLFRDGYFTLGTLRKVQAGGAGILESHPGGPPVFVCPSLRPEVVATINRTLEAKPRLESWVILLPDFPQRYIT